MDHRFTAQERAAFEADKEYIRQRLRGQRCPGEEIVELSIRMVRIRKRRWWMMDDQDPDPNGWSQALFGIGSRQASKYFTIGDGLRPDEVGQDMLTVDHVHQIRLTPPPLRQDLRVLTREAELGYPAMSAGRRAALRPLAEGNLAEARRLMERAALLREAQERAAEDAEAAGDRPPGPAPDPDPNDGKHALASVLRHLSKAAYGIEQVGQQRARGQKVAVSGLEKARELAQAVLDAAEAMLARDAEVEEEEAAEESTGRTNQEVDFRPGPANSVKTGSGISFALLLGVLAALDVTTQGELCRCLYELIRGEPVEERVPFLEKVKALLQEGGAPAALCQRWFDLLCQRDQEGRGVFALWFAGHAHLPGLAMYARLLRRQELPPRLKQAVEALFRAPQAEPARAAAAAGS